MSKVSIDTSSNRARLFDKMRTTLGGASDQGTREQAVRERLERHGRNLVPERSNLDAAGQLELFRAQAEAVSASVVDVDSHADIPEAIADYLRQHNLPARVKHGDDKVLTTLPWDKTPALARDHGPAHGDDAVSLSHAFAGVAETGTLILASGPDNPTSLNFLPENHIVVLDAATLGGSYEDAWDRLRGTYGAGNMPRAVNMISGPSRTADVEQTIQLGAHGPRRLHIIIVRES